MSQVRLACGLPFCQNPKDIQTNSSVGLRVTSVALGVLAAALGALILFNIPGLSQLGTTPGWALVSIGTFLSLAATSIKCVQEAREGVDEKPDTSALPEKQVPDDSVLAKLPTWLSSQVADVSYITVPKDRVEFTYLKPLADPVTLFSSGDVIGLCMRLNVKHVSIDVSYDRSGEAEADYGELNSSSKDPFKVHIIAWLSPRIDWKAGENDSYWSLISEPKHCIEHRNASFETNYILGDSIFKWYLNNPLVPEVIDRFLNTEKQEDLPSEHQNNLGWILLRLFNNKHFEIRERKTDSIIHSSEEPTVGYWQLSLDR